MHLQIYQALKFNCSRITSIVSMHLEKWGVPGTHGLCMRKVPSVTCILLCYTKTTAYITSPAERFYCRIMLPIGTLRSITAIALKTTLCSILFWGDPWTSKGYPRDAMCTCQWVNNFFQVNNRVLWLFPQSMVNCRHLSDGRNQLTEVSVKSAIRCFLRFFKHFWTGV